MLGAQLFGVPRFTYLGTPIALSEKMRLVLAYLACQDAPTQRQELLRLLWLDGKPHNLRQTLANLRKLPGAEVWLLDDAKAVQVLAQTDTAAFLRLAEDDPAGALALLRGEFLEVDLSAYPDLELWRSEERAHLHSVIQSVRRRQAAICVEQGDRDGAREQWDAVLRADPLDEDAAQRLIALHLQAGRREQATAVYAQLRGELLRMGTQPHPRTAALLGLERDYPELLAQARTLLSAELQPGSPALWSQVVGLPELEVAHWMTLNFPAVPPVAPPLAALWHTRLAQHLPELDERPAGMPRHRFLALIADHWRQAGRSREAARYFHQAGREAHRVGANDAALDCLNMALEHSDDEERLELLTRKAGLLELLGQAQGMLSVSGELREYAARWQSDLALLGAEVSAAGAWLRLGDLSQMEAHTAAAEYVLERLNRAGVDIAAALRGRVYSLRGALHLRAGHLAQAAKSYHAALAYPVPPDLRVRLLTNLGTVYGLQGELRESLRTLEDCVSVARDHGDLNVLAAVLVNLGTTAERLGLSTQAVRHYQEGVALAKRLGMTPTMQAAYRNLASLHLRLGQLGHAWNTASELLEDADLTPDQRLLIDLLLAEVEWLCGQPQAAHLRLQAYPPPEAESTDRNALLLRAYRGILTLMRRRESGDALSVLQQARAAGHQDLVWDVALDALLYLPEPTDMHALLDWLGEVPPETPAFKMRRRLAELLLCARNGETVSDAELLHLSGQPLTHRWVAARLLCQLWPTPAHEEQLERVLKEQAQALPKGLRETFQAQAGQALF